MRGSNLMNNKRVKILIMMLAILAVVSVLLAACARPGTPQANQGGNSSSGGGGGGATVHLGATNFVQSTVTITKGSMLTLIDDVQVEHIINNGTWVNGNPKPGTEPGAPTVNVTFTGGDTHTIGPFTTAGTFHLYCTIHTGMNLTVTVK
jgi:plastocyanin